MAREGQMPDPCLTLALGDHSPQPESQHLGTSPTFSRSILICLRISRAGALKPQLSASCLRELTHFQWSPFLSRGFWNGKQISRHQPNRLITWHPYPSEQAADSGSLRWPGDTRYKLIRLRSESYLMLMSTVAGTVTQRHTVPIAVQDFP